MSEKRVFSISGMRCTACSGNVEKRLKKLEGVISCEVSFASQQAVVCADESVSDELIISTVAKLGFTAVPERADSAPEPETPCSSSSKSRFIFAAAATAALIAISMGHLMHGTAGAVIQILLTSVVIYAGRNFFRRGIPALLSGYPDMDTLISCGSGAAVIYSLFLVFSGSAGHLHFDSAAMIIFLVMCGKSLEERVRRNTIDAVRSLAELVPETAFLVRGSEIVEVKASTLVKGDILQVNSGSRVPADGVVVSGSGWVDESMFTGETLAVEKLDGAQVTGGTLCTGGAFRMRAEKLGQDTLLSGIIDMVKMAQSAKAPVARLADTAAGYFTYFVLGAALLTLIIHLACGNGAYLAINFALSVMVVSCPCALGLATPVAIIAAVGRGAASGILIKSGEALERACKISCAAFDKTGTLTSGEITLEKIFVCSGISETELLKNLASAEQGTAHPLAKSAVSAAKEKGLDLNSRLNGFVNTPGRGISVEIEDRQWLFGSKAYLEDCGVDTAGAPDAGIYSTIYISCDGRLAGVAAFGSKLRRNAAETVSRLHAMGIRCVMLSGDRQKTAEAVAQSVGIDECRAGLLPQEKLQIVQELQKKGVLAMVGDGVNDAPALARADIGIAIGGGSACACDAAGIVIVGDDIYQVARAVSLSRAAMRVIKQNLFWAFFYNLAAIPAAAGAFYAFGLPALPPGVCAGAMAASSLTVVLNAARLKGIKL